MWYQLLCNPLLTWHVHAACWSHAHYQSQCVLYEAQLSTSKQKTVSFAMPSECTLTFRRSGLFPVENRVFLTFEPDHLTVPDSPPFPLPHYSIFYTPAVPEAAAIVQRAVTLLGVSPLRVSTEGFEYEDDMVGNLTALDQAFAGGCFVHGAGEHCCMHDSTVCVWVFQVSASRRHCVQQPWVKCGVYHPSSAWSWVTELLVNSDIRTFLWASWSKN